MKSTIKPGGRQRRIVEVMVRKLAEEHGATKRLAEFWQLHGVTQANADGCDYFAINYTVPENKQTTFSGLAKPGEHFLAKGYLISSRRDGRYMEIEPIFINGLLFGFRLSVMHENLKGLNPVMCWDDNIGEREPLAVLDGKPRFDAPK